MADTIKTSDVIFRPDLYPRFKPDAALIQNYAENIERLPSIDVNQDNILIDGYHRWKAHETAGREEVPCIVIVTKSEAELQILAVAKNSRHGKQLSPDEKKKYAILWWQTFPDSEIMEALSIDERTFRRWTKNKRDEFSEIQRKQVLDLWLACYTHEEISKMLKISRATVTERIGENVENGHLSDSDIFPDFNQDDSHRRIYTVWNFPKATNEVKHFGNIPPEIIDNLLFLYTSPFDVVFDPFGGGGSTIDMCIKRKRRYYVSDLNPIPARSDIRKHDITTGLPDDLPVPDLVFLDPPYWQQAKGRYSEEKTDLANISLDDFISAIGSIAHQVKRKWHGAKRSGKLSLIIGPYKDNGRVIDLAFLCYEVISKYLKLAQRIIVPYSTEIHGGAFVKMAKEKKEILYLYRDLMVFEMGEKPS